ncbi:MAG: hypothetical protein ACI4ES_06225 [Roseburia sp.]
MRGGKAILIPLAEDSGQKFMVFQAVKRLKEGIREGKAILIPSGEDFGQKFMVFQAVKW